METLGHSGISITMDLYTHVLPEQQREAADRMQTALQWGEA
jgi:integrase